MPENSGYMFAAFIAAAVIIGGYVVSIVVRARALARRGDAIGSVTQR